MFNSVQVKHEFMGAEDVNTSSRVNPVNSKYPILFHPNVDHKCYQVPQLWGPSQNEIIPKIEVYEPQKILEVGENESFMYAKDYVQNNTLFQLNQHPNIDVTQTELNLQCNESIMQSNTQPQCMVNVQEPELPSDTLPTTQLLVKQNRPGRPPKIASESNVRKLKCQCEICFKEFGHKSNLFIHMRTHNGERPYKCTQCEKCFTHSGNLAIHMRTHSGERPYGCQICGKMFSHSGNLSTHLRTHSGVKPYKCSVCAKEFRHSGNLSIHERIHSGIKPFQCKVCGKEFYHSGNLTTHMKKHSIENSINVNQCENNDNQVLCTSAEFNNSVRLSTLNNLPLISVNNIKSISDANNVPIKDESNEYLTPMGEMLPVDNSEYN